MSKSISKDMVLDPNTFGGSAACHVLVDFMNQGMIPIRDKHKVLSFLHTCNLNFTWIALIQHKCVRESTLVTIRDSYLVRVDKMPYPLKFNTYLKNVIFYMFKKNLEEANRAIAASNG